ncbi:hypothetical protein [Algoriphagus sediminis]|uniref:Uncharacterized protein n=1 Tax=Algoriphagus sediminis TaxID=3057113 RepID=A0ABT7YEV0_9BACT|nr:hypothetical protein [Algoriphagus sediminis]MDN3205052.1 hypothetical protein [Algoriphagus sediminis]
MKRVLRKVLMKIGLIHSRPTLVTKHEDEETIKIQEELSFQVYWKILSIGKGPAVILKAFDEEILKFDCFGEKKGHFHNAPHYNFRIYFTESTIEEQIERTIRELKVNGLKYLSVQKDDRIRKIKPNGDEYEKALKQVKDTLIKHHQTMLNKIPET